MEVVSSRDSREDPRRHDRHPRKDPHEDVTKKLQGNGSRGISA